MNNTNTKYAVLTYTYFSCNGGTTEDNYIAGVFNTRDEAKNYIKKQIEDIKQRFNSYRSPEVVARCLSVTKNSIGWFGRDEDYRSYKIQKIAA